MRVLIVSDSHGRNQHLARVIEQVSPVDMVIHLGDLEGSDEYLKKAVTCPLEMISGNNDYFTQIEREKVIQIQNYRVVLTHGHRHNVYSGTGDIKEWARTLKADIVMFGHTHQPLLEIDEDIIAVNPGSISQPRQEGHRPSFIIMDIDRFGEAHFAINYV